MSERTIAKIEFIDGRWKAVLDNGDILGSAIVTQVEGSSANDYANVELKAYLTGKVKKPKTDKDLIADAIDKAVEHRIIALFEDLKHRHS